MRAFIQEQLSEFFIPNTVKNGQVWLILENAEKYPFPTIPPPEIMGGQCGEMGLLMELLLRCVGLEAKYIHLKPSLDHIIYSTLQKSNSTLYELDPPHPECQVVNPIAEILQFYFVDYGGWQKGEGSVFYKNEIYTMFAKDVRANGADITIAARNAMLNFQKLNESKDSTDYKLQRWKLIHVKNWFERCKIGATVEIPSN